MPGPIFLEGERLTLRPVRPEDYAFVARHFTNPWMRHGAFEDIHTPVTEEGVAARVEEADDFHMFLACRDQTSIGSAFLVDVDLEVHNAELGYFITPDEQGNGYATEAADLCLTQAFDELGLHKVWARTVEDNDASKRVLEKLGFEREGILREHRWDSVGTVMSTCSACWNPNDRRRVSRTASGKRTGYANWSWSDLLAGPR